MRGDVRNLQVQTVVPVFYIIPNKLYMFKHNLNSSCFRLIYI